MLMNGKSCLIPLLLLSRCILMIIDDKLITVVPGSNFKFTLYLSYLVIDVTFNRSGVLSSWLYQNCLEQLLTTDKGLKQSTIGKVIFILLLHASNLKICNFLIFCQIFMIFLRKCRALYVVLEKGHDAREKGHGVAPC